MSESDARRRARERQAALAALRQEVAATLAQARADRAAQAAATRRELKRYITTLRHGQHAYPSVTPVIPVTPAQPPTPPVAMAEPPVLEQPIQEVIQAPSTRDDLTIIWGIGPALQQRLYTAGIRTYADLANRNPEQIRRALGESGRASQIEQWIDQARTLAGMH
jgi:predicted flap endonuclease-1-like 5' DNA nuclease